MDLAGNGQCVQILGAGAAGLSAGYFARKNDIEFRINEASSEIGGNAVTFRSGDFLYDSGAHRWHDKDPEMTREIQVLLGERLRRISIPAAFTTLGGLLISPCPAQSNPESGSLAIRQGLHGNHFVALGTAQL